MSLLLLLRPEAVGVDATITGSTGSATAAGSSGLLNVTELGSTGAATAAGSAETTRADSTITGATGSATASGTASAFKVTELGATGSATASGGPASITFTGDATITGGTGSAAASGGSASFKVAVPAPPSDGGGGDGDVDESDTRDRISARIVGGTGSATAAGTAAFIRGVSVREDARIRGLPGSARADGGRASWTADAVVVGMSAGRVHAAGGPASIRGEDEPDERFVLTEFFGMLDE